MNPKMSNQGASLSGSLQFLTVEEVAAMLRLKTRTVYEMVSQNRIPFRKAGRRTVFLLEEILAWTATPQKERS